MMLSTRLLLSHSHDPWFNLSIEEYIFQNMKPNQVILFLWRNQNSVVIGRAQNAWKECNTRRIERDGIRLVRRYSGGGAVFQDLGNTCFTFMFTYKEYNKNIPFNIILDGLNRIGIKAIISGRNDIIINTKEGQRKISGSAYRETSDRWLHHGTLLLNVDLNKLTYYLNPDQKKLNTKGITSIRARVTNLNTVKSDITHKEVCHHIQEAFHEHYQIHAIPEIVSIEDFIHITEFSKQLEKQRDWNWNFGSTPFFTHQLDNRFDWGSVEVYFNIQNGIINQSRIFTDSLNPIPLEKLSTKLIGIPYNIYSIQNCCEKWIENCSQPEELKEVTDWLVKNIA